MKKSLFFINLVKQIYNSDFRELKKMFIFWFCDIYCVSY